MKKGFKRGRSQDGKDQERAEDKPDTTAGQETRATDGKRGEGRIGDGSKKNTGPT